MIRLDVTTKILQLIATGTANVTVSGLNVTTSAAPGFSEETAATASTQTISAAPAASTVKQIDHVSSKNTAAGVNTFTLQMYNSVGPVTTVLAKVTVGIDETFEYTHAAGYGTLDASGGRKSSQFGIAIASGKTLTVSNSLTLAGTNGTTMTFPSTSATIARTDAANTFTGTQTFGVIAPTTINAFAMGGAISNPSNYAANFGSGALTAGAANLESIISSGGIKSTGGTSGGANQTTVDFSTNGRFLAWGPNTSTPGELDFGAVSSDASVGSTAIARITSTGLAVTGTISATTSFTSGNPNTGTAKPWKFGSLITGQVGLVVISTQYVELDVNGTLVKLATV